LKKIRSSVIFSKKYLKKNYTCFEIVVAVDAVAHAVVVVAAFVVVAVAAVDDDVNAYYYI
jgi:hypothetical protein